jgi:hypothetical protein
MMKKQLKTAQQRAKDRKAIRDLTKKLHVEAFELVEEFKVEWHCHCDITELSIGLVSRMLNIDSHSLDRLKLRATQEFVGDEFEENTTWKGVYDEK